MRERRWPKLRKKQGFGSNLFPITYSTKKELFLEVYQDVVQEERLFVQSYFQDHAEEPLEHQLYNFLTEHKNRFLTNPNASFMLVLSSFTPLEVYDYVISQFRLYLAILKEEVAACFSKHTCRLSPEECAIAFSTLLDGLDVQLLYENSQAYEKVQRITWNIFWAGIQG